MRFKASAILCATGLASLALAQFDGPSPVAWRWSQGAIQAPRAARNPRQPNQPAQPPSALTPVGSPAVDGDAVFVSVGGRSYSLSRIDGNENWRFPAQDPLTTDYFRNQPVVAGNRVICRTAANILYGLDKTTGKGMWQYRFHKAIVGDFGATTDYVVVALSDGTLNVLNTVTGDEVWPEPVKYDEGVSGSPAVSGNNIIFFTATGYMRCVNIATKKESWSQRFESYGSQVRPILYGDYIYANSGNYVVCLSAFDGHLKWERDTGNLLVAWPGVSADGAVVVDRKGEVFAYDSISGHVLLRNPIQLGVPCEVAPGAAGNLFVAAEETGELSLFDPHTGKILWRYVTPVTGAPTARRTPSSNGVPAAGSPVASATSLFVLGQDGSLFCFDKTNGVDVTPPLMKLFFPNPGDSVNGDPPLTLYFTIFDDSSGYDPDSVRILVDGKQILDDKGKEVRPELIKEGYYILRVSDKGPIKPFRDGRHVFTLKASDWMGNAGSEDFILIIDNQLPPMETKDAQSQGNQGGGGAGGGRGGGG